jgi:hypothetical protein
MKSSSPEKDHPENQMDSQSDESKQTDESTKNSDTISTASNRPIDTLERHLSSEPATRLSRRSIVSNTRPKSENYSDNDPDWQPDQNSAQSDSDDDPDWKPDLRSTASGSARGSARRKASGSDEGSARGSARRKASGSAQESAWGSDLSSAQGSARGASASANDLTRRAMKGAGIQESLKRVRDLSQSANLLGAPPPPAPAPPEDLSSSPRAHVSHAQKLAQRNDNDKGGGR